MTHLYFIFTAQNYSPRPSNFRATCCLPHGMFRWLAVPDRRGPGIQYGGTLTIPTFSPRSDNWVSRPAKFPSGSDLSHYWKVWREKVGTLKKGKFHFVWGELAIACHHHDAVSSAFDMTLLSTTVYAHESLVDVSRFRDRFIFCR